ncbi:MAG: tyrosine-type recombinase/integrase [Actinomycetota bacterium]|nr:tyrosine-type recombinase/integrase [Actinomycetota bacterium]
MSVYKRGDSWYIDLIIKGRRINKKAGRTKGEAREAEASIRAQARAAQFGLAAAYPLKTFHSAMTEFLEHQAATKAPATYAGDKWYYEKHLQDFWGERQLTSITSENLIDFQKLKKSSALGNRTVNICVNLVRKALHYSAIKGWCPSPSMLKFPKLTEPRRLHAYLAPEEYQRLLKGFTPRGWMAYYRTIFGVLTGLRPAELSYLAWTDVDTSMAMMRVTSKPKEGWQIKTNQERAVPLSLEALEVLGAVKKMISEKNKAPRRRKAEIKTPWVFSDGPRPVKSIKIALRTASTKAKLSRTVTANMLRHTFATHALRAGSSIKAVKDLMGHTEIETTEKYLHVLPEDLRDTVARVSIMSKNEGTEPEGR